MNSKVTSSSSDVNLASSTHDICPSVAGPDPSQISFVVSDVISPTDLLPLDPATSDPLRSEPLAANKCTHETTGMPNSVQCLLSTPLQQEQNDNICEKIQLPKKRKLALQQEEQNSSKQDVDTTSADIVPCQREENSPHSKKFKCPSSPPPANTSGDLCNDQKKEGLAEDDDPYNEHNKIDLDESTQLDEECPGRDNDEDDETNCDATGISAVITEVKVVCQDTQHKSTKNTIEKDKKGEEDDKSFCNDNITKNCESTPTDCESHTSCCSARKTHTTTPDSNGMESA